MSLFAKIDCFSSGCNVVSSDELMKVKLGLLGADLDVVSGTNVVSKINEIYGDNRDDNCENNREYEGDNDNNEDSDVNRNNGIKNNENGTR